MRTLLEMHTPGAELVVGTYLTLVSYAIPSAVAGDPLPIVVTSMDADRNPSSLGLTDADRAPLRGAPFVGSVRLSDFTDKVMERRGKTDPRPCDTRTAMTVVLENENVTTLTRPALSAREIEVLRTWVICDSKDEVGSLLYISGATVNTHISRIRVKYEEAGRPANTKATLLARALQDGYVRIDDI